MVDLVAKSDAAPEAKKDGWFERALAVHLVAGRFSSPAGIVFVQQNYLPLLLLLKRG